MKIRLQYLIIFVLLVSVSLITSFTANFSLSENNTTPQVNYLGNYQESFNLTNNGLLDYVLLKTEISTNVPVYINTHYLINWSSTKNGVNGYSGIPAFYMPAGTYNVTYFLGLGGMKAVNNPNTLVSGTYSLNLTALDINNPQSNSTIILPKITFEFNTSQISDVISDGRLFSPIALSFASHTESYSYYKWNYTGNNGLFSNFLREVNHFAYNQIANGSVSLEINRTLDGFPIGKVFNNNVSFTTENVPVGYPFSFLKLPRQISFDTFKEMWVDSQTTYLDYFNVSYFSNTTTYGVNMSEIDPGAYLTQYLEFNQTSGILMKYEVHAFGPYLNASDLLVLTEYNSTTDYSVIPIDSTQTSLSSTSVLSTSLSSSSSIITSSSSAGSSNNKSSSVPIGFWFVISAIISASLIVRRRNKPGT